MSRARVERYNACVQSMCCQHMPGSWERADSDAAYADGDSLVAKAQHAGVKSALQAEFTGARMCTNKRLSTHSQTDKSTETTEAMMMEEEEEEEEESPQDGGWALTAGTHEVSPESNRVLQSDRS
ncbi:hypothetical protein MPTK1_8g13120 [Marchantia polymorpha subsp. ruderalis]|uniref:Uncharacterized protein n=1 Tax=Marchantia polymorpha TaxID=3197 RepID=A0A2R6WJK6_MARPO|nr:hypothetical protein MARPO_0083s0009 [Marchantia polymorpha]BBN19727.1 hypothetical protein Mp_8g13120 [Marchantia polymorpha subsp. ruderalis]|eukprot:PTQ34040.1 hypothetical protein MARPO_0083s0009 [Marchantia polymorpha]